jgi:hypothetical protein
LLVVLRIKEKHRPHNNKNMFFKLKHMLLRVFSNISIRLLRKLVKKSSIIATTRRIILIDLKIMI